MKRSIRWYLAWGIMVASLSMLLFMVTAGPAQAWTQEDNIYSDTGSGSGYCSGQDGNDSNHPCYYWREPHYTSITLTFQMDTSLTSTGYDFPVAINSAFEQYEAVPAWNPYMEECFTFCDGAAGEYYLTTLPCGTAGNTTPLVSPPTPERGYNPQRGGDEWYTFFRYVYVGFSNSISWNSDDYWTTNCDAPPLHADGVGAALHESGHAIGLGHTTDCPAIMNATCMASHALNHLSTNSDIPAVEGIYPGNQQSS